MSWTDQKAALAIRRVDNGWLVTLEPDGIGKFRTLVAASPEHLGQLLTAWGRASAEAVPLDGGFPLELGPGMRLPASPSPQPPAATPPASPSTTPASAPSAPPSPPAAPPPPPPPPNPDAMGDLLRFGPGQPAKPPVGGAVGA